MELILWRHAEAKLGDSDEDRILSTKGRKQATRTAAWLNANLPENCRILVSPATRTIQTAETLGRKYRIHPDLGPGATPEAILAAANWPEAKETVLIVGHQPALGQIAALLLAGMLQDWRIRRGNVWWIAQTKETASDQSNYLRAVIAPELIAPNLPEPR